MILGVDLGNYATKTSRRVNFLSKVTFEGDLEEKGDNIILEGRKIYLGQGEYDTEYRKAYKKSLLKLLYGAMLMSTEDINNYVVLGLPLSQYKEDKEHLMNVIMQNNKKEIMFNDMARKINIQDVEIVPEGVAAVPGDYEGIIIDIGGRTTDICLLLKEGGKRRIQKPYSLPLGTLNLESDFIISINKKLGLDLLQRDAERILNNGLKIYGEEQNIDFAMEVYKQFVDKIISQVQVDYPIKTFDIALVGGGAESLYKPIKKRLPNAMLVENSFYANALGYEEIGRGIWE